MKKILEKIKEIVLMPFQFILWIVLALIWSKSEEKEGK